MDKVRQNTISQLEQVKSDLLEKKEYIIEKSEKINERIDQLIQTYKSLTINQEQKIAFQKDCIHYLKVLDTLIQEANQQIKIIEKLSEIETEIKIGEIKKFIKKVTKDILIGHSRFRYSFETQNKQLDLLEMQLKS